jgi:hypothetical protein
MRALLLGAAIWLAIFFLGVLPYAGIQTWKVHRRPQATGVFSNFRVVAGTKGSRYVLATLDFDRPSATGVVHCRIDPYRMDTLNSRAASVTRAQFAVRDDSCAEAIRLPLSTPSDLLGWVYLFFIGLICALAGICFLGFAATLDRVGRRRRVSQSKAATNL